MFTRVESIHIAAKPEAVFDYVADFSRHPEWAHENIEVEPLLDAAESGGKFSFTVHFMGTSRGELRVLESVRPRRLRYEAEDASSLYEWTFDIEPEGGGSRLAHSLVRKEEMAVVRAIQPLMWNYVGRRMVAGGLANIKARVEQTAEA
jgi:uncharacterized protein YndB with AHSA1/START domain